MELEMWSGVRDVGHRMGEFCIYYYDVRIKLEAIDGEESSILWNTVMEITDKNVKVSNRCVKVGLWKQTLKE